LDIKEFFENVNHELLFKALKLHVSEKWVLLYIRRWLEASVQLPDGTLLSTSGNGTPQGGVISPLLANLFMHYCFDKWLIIHYPEVQMVRYADDIIVHCRTQSGIHPFTCSYKATSLGIVALQLIPKRQK